MFWFGLALANPVFPSQSVVAYREDCEKLKNSSIRECQYNLHGCLVYQDFCSMRLYLPHYNTLLVQVAPNIVQYQVDLGYERLVASPIISTTGPFSFNAVRSNNVPVVSNINHDVVRYEWEETDYDYRILNLVFWYMAPREEAYNQTLRIPFLNPKSFASACELFRAFHEDEFDETCKIMTIRGLYSHRYGPSSQLLAKIDLWRINKGELWFSNDQMGPIIVNTNGIPINFEFKFKDAAEPFQRAEQCIISVKLFSGEVRNTFAWVSLLYRISCPSGYLFSGTVEQLPIQLGSGFNIQPE
ncbi:hypothetical protein EDD86DRAFT_137858 [Gorgonomyces haynaldii]|nr:hypothetical protein EDD86DRAFT_137858 [Gorgonomyces haynaldii]